MVAESLSQQGESRCSSLHCSWPQSHSVFLLKEGVLAKAFVIAVLLYTYRFLLLSQKNMFRDIGLN
jgi:hypothetical protein